MKCANIVKNFVLISFSQKCQSWQLKLYRLFTKFSTLFKKNHIFGLWKNFSSTLPVFCFIYHTEISNKNNTILSNVIGQWMQNLNFPRWVNSWRLLPCFDSDSSAAAAGSTVSKNWVWWNQAAGGSNSAAADKPKFWIRTRESGRRNFSFFMWKRSQNWWTQ